MKIAASSASFADAIAAGRLTQLEWLDVCANELEVDGVVFAAAQFPRTDDEYLAQLKKSAVDLGLTVAAYACEDAGGGAPDAAFAIAAALGAPIAIATPPADGDDPSAWGRFASDLKDATRAAKRANVTIALRAAAGTLCPTGAELRRIAKDVDSAWLRFAYDTSVLRAADDARALLGKAPIAIVGSETHADAAALERFRGFLVLERRMAPGTDADAYHRAVAAVRLERLRALERDDDHTAVCMPG